MKKILCSQHGFGLLLSASLLLTGTASAQSWQSVRALPANTNIISLVGDGTGGYFMAGVFAGTLTLGSYSLTSAGGSDGFFAHLNAAGDYVQAVRMGGSGEDAATKVAVDAAGLVTVAGLFASPSIAFGTTTLTNANTGTIPSQDIFVARLNTSGSWTQAAQCGSPADDNILSLGLDPSGSAVIAGSFSGSSARFGSNTITGSAGEGTQFVARLGSTGTWTQAVRIENAGGSGPASFCSDMAVAADGTAVITGFCPTGKSISFGNYYVDARYYGGVTYVARLARNGTWVQAVQTTGGGGNAIPHRIVLDAAGNAVVMGETSAVTNFGLIKINANSKGNFVPFVARLNAAGTWTQAAHPGNTNDSCYSQDMAVDGSGNVWLTGVFKSSTISFGTTTLTNSDPNASNTNHFDLFVAQLSSTGTWKFATAVVGASPLTLALNRGTVALAGYFSSSATFGPITLTSSAQTTGFLATLGGGVLPTRTIAPTYSASLAWPNPASGYTTLNLAAEATPRPVQLFDALGREVRRLELPAHATSAKINLAGLPSGCYLLRCGATNGRLVVD